MIAIRSTCNWSMTPTPPTPPPKLYVWQRTDIAGD